MKSRAVLILMITLCATIAANISMACPRSDINGDCKVNLEDLAILASEWLTNGTPEPTGMTWVAINDSGAGMKDISHNPISHGGFNGKMSKYETTNAQYCQFLNTALDSGDIIVGEDNIVYGANGSNSGTDYIDEVYFDTYAASSDSQIIYSNGTFSVRDRDGHSMNNHPVVEVSWYGATAFCNYYGYRLPTEWEWQAVADFNGSFIYGCGTTIDPNIVNYKDNEYANPLGLSSMPYTNPVDYYPVYGYGMANMSGNVMEWTSSYLEEDGRYTVVGGSWKFDRGECLVANHLYGYPSFTPHIVGFRVCKD